MEDTPVDPEADTFRGLALVLRARAGATQREVATHAGVSERAVRYWEAGLSHPGAASLRRLIAFYLARGVFTPGREGEEAAALWAAAVREAPRLKAPFDGAWFAARLAEARATAPPAPSPAARPDPPRADWGEAPAANAFHGRAQEVAALARWLGADRRRLVGLLGLGGVGKTALAARAARALAGDFDAVHWRSLRNALPCAEWLAGVVLFLSEQQVAPAEGEEARLRQVLGLLRVRRCLLVLDNLETVLEAGAPEARYRSEYAGYGRVLEALGEAGHGGCLLVTSREQPPDLRPGEGVALLRLGGLDVAAGRALLAAKGLAGDAAAWEALVERYGGNALALQVVGETIGEIFGGDIAAFLAYATATDGVAFGGIRRLLDAQMERLSATERAVVVGLAVAREPVGFGALLADLGPATPLGAALEAVEGLGRRSLLERGEAATFTLQPVVLEHATARLVEAVAAEVARGEPALLAGQALVQATAKEHVRRSQERLIGAPILRRLQADGGAGGAERRLLALLDGWRGRPAAEQGYGSGNVVNLLRLLRSDLRGTDLSHLAIRQAYLAEVEAQDASLAGAHLAEAVLAEAFTYPQTVALSADGALLAAGTSTGEVHLWRVADRTPLLVAAGHTGGVWAVALSADGGLLASGGFDATVRLWEAPSGRPLATLHGHTGAIRGVALSADGRLLASGSFDATVRLWEAPSGRPLATLHGHTGGVEAVALAADGRLAASGGFDGAVRLWEAGSGRPLATLHGHTGAIRGVALAADGRLAASGGADGDVRLWETGSGRPLATLDGHAGGVWGVALSADGGLLASGGADGAVKLWEAPSGRPLATLHGHTGGVRGVALSADGRLAASGGFDATVRLWEAPSGRPLATLHGHTGGVEAVALAADGRLAASGGADGAVRLWEAGSGRPLATLHGHTGAIRGVALAADGRLAASGGFDGAVRLWEAGSGRPLATLHGHAGGVWGVALSADGGLAASGSFDATVRLWEAPSGRPLATLHGHTGGVRGVALSADGGLLASGGIDGTVRLWEAPSGRPLATLHGHTGGVWGVALSVDGRLAASGGIDGTVRLWEAPSGRPLATLHGHTGGVEAVALAADGRLAASGGADGAVRLWEAPSGRPLAALHGHTGAIRGVALAADGRLAASGGADGAVRLWEAESGASLHVLRSERRYERLDITGLTGVTEAQRAALLALGAVERGA